MNLLSGGGGWLIDKKSRLILISIRRTVQTITSIVWARPFYTIAISMRDEGGGGGGRVSGAKFSHMNVGF